MDDKPRKSKRWDSEKSSKSSSQSPESSKKQENNESSFESLKSPDVKEVTKSTSREDNIFQSLKSSLPQALAKPSVSGESEKTPKPESSEPESSEVVPVSEKPEERSTETLSENAGTPKLKSALKRPSSEFTPSPKRKRSSIVSFLMGRSSDEPEQPKPKRRPSFVKRKLVALEKELTLDNINKTVTRVFQPQLFGGDEKADKEKGEDEMIQKPQRSYLSSSMACMFLISATTGSAIASLPFFLMISSWFGVFFNLLLGFNALYAGLCTGWCWSIMEEKWPQYLEYTRIPYQDIAYRAVGGWMKYIVAFCVDLSVLGSCAGYILFIADLLESIYDEKIDFCLTLIIFSAILTPIIMFASYRNIKFIAVCDVLFSVLFTLLLVISFFLNKSHQGISSYTDPSYESVFMAFAGFSFAYGSGAIIPSIIADMADRSLWTETCSTAYMICIVIYIVLPIMGYAAYGDKTPRFILKSVLTSPNYYYFGIVISFIHIFQLATSYVVALMPTLHAFEVRVNCPDRFSIYRVIIRLLLVTFILVVILGIPYLTKFLDLVGATTMNLVTFIFPPAFYVCLVHGEESKSKNRKISKKEWILVAEIILLAISVGCMATYMTIKQYRESPSNRISCYLDMKATEE